MFAIGTFEGADGVPFPGLVVDGAVHDLRPEFTDTLAHLPRLGRLRSRACTSLPRHPPGLP